MFLKDLIEWLEKQNPKAVVPYGFGLPHSFRGYYQDLAFEPTGEACIGDMLAYARGALGVTFEGYKGGEFTMSEYTECWISPYGTSDKVALEALGHESVYVAKSSYRLCG